MVYPSINTNKMDWKYIFSLSLDNLTDAKKDELYNTIAWFDCEGDENLNLNKCVVLIKLSQTIMKHKGEQVINKIYLNKCFFFFIETLLYLGGSPISRIG